MKLKVATPNTITHSDAFYNLVIEQHALFWCNAFYFLLGNSMQNDVCMKRRNSFNSFYNRQLVTSKMYAVNRLCTCLYLSWTELQSSSFAKSLFC